jgi:hypothetical protein
MDLLRTAPEVFNFADLLIKQTELISGVNEVSRGNAPATLSGAAMALIQQQAIQFSSGLQSSYNTFLEKIGSATIELIKTFAESPRVAQIVGKNKKSMLKKFKSDDLLGISRVVVDMGNPLMKTGAGKMQIADTLLQTGLIKTPEQYIMALTTGNVEPLYEHERSTQTMIREENEALMEGDHQEVVNAIPVDDHALHVLEHTCVLNNLEARMNPGIVKAVLTHIQQHIELAKTEDPVFASMKKTASFFQPPVEQKPQGNLPEAMNNQQPITEKAASVKPAQPAQSPLQ